RVKWWSGAWRIKKKRYKRKAAEARNKHKHKHKRCNSLSLQATAEARQGGTQFVLLNPVQAKAKARMGCASSKNLESVLTGQGLKRYSNTLPLSRNKNKIKNKNDLHNNGIGDHHHHVALTSSTYGVFNPHTFQSEEEAQHSPERGKTFDSSPNQILKKLKNLESDSAPEPWCEVSKVLDNLKEKDKCRNVTKPLDTNITAITFHTVEELDAKTGSHKNIPPENTKKIQNQNQNLCEDEPKVTVADMKAEGPPIPCRDRVVEAKTNPLLSFEDKCPPGGEKAVVLYTTSLRGIRKTFDDCNKVRSVLQNFGIPIDERDVSMHLEFRNELKELMGKPVPVPRLFIKGRDIGVAEEVLQLNDVGKLDDLLTGFSTGTAARVCDGCGGMRFVPCLECSGSCRLITDECLTVRCPHCNENGLIQCPICC
ncbi:hypothetical protein KI387_023997, partial [Taxus chinensis]